MDDYLEQLKEVNLSKDQKMIPWRSGTIPIEHGTTTIKGLNQHC